MDNQQFDDTIRESKKELQSLESVGSSITGSIKSLGLQFAAAAGLMEAFDTAMNSNASVQQKWGDALGTAKESVDSFFTSLTTGDWSIFEGGILNAIKLSKKYQKAMRELQASLDIGDVKISFEEKELNRLENRMNDKNLSKEERDAARKQFESLGSSTTKDMEIQEQFAQEKLNELLEGKGVKPTGKVRDMIFKYLDPTAEGKKLLDKYKEVDTEIRQISSQMLNPQNQNKDMQKRLKEQLATASEKRDRIVAVDSNIVNAKKFVDNFGDQESYQKLLEVIDKIVGYQDRIETVKKQVYDGLNDTDSTGSGGGGGGKEEIIPKGSLKELEKQIADIKSQIKLSVDDKSRIELKKELDRLEEEERVIKFRYEKVGAAGSKLIQPQAFGGFASMAGNKPKDALTFNKKSKKLKNPYSKKDVKTNNKYVDSLNAIAQVMGNVTAMTNEGAAAWISWAGNLMSAVASAIPAITALISAKKAEAVTNGVASATQTPLVGWLLAGAAAAAVIGALAAVPAFEGGGIFQSNLTSGDKNFARLNGGEMILNKGQQYNLFKLLDNGGPMGSGGEVQFKIRGQELVGILSNYNKKISKVR